MMKRTGMAALAAVLAAGLATSAMAATLTDAAKTALGAALEDEHRAEAFYAAVIAKFGEVRPFTNIIKAERVHARELITVMKTYGLDPVANPFLKDPAVAALVPATVAEACQMGVKAEIDNRDLYDNKLMPAVTGYPDIKVVFQSLRDASQNKHLPAFQRCVARGGGPRANNPS